MDKLKIAVIGKRHEKRNDNYYDVVSALGADSLEIVGEDDLKNILPYADMVIIPGGVDINPALYGEFNTDSRDIDDDLDKVEFQIFKYAVENHIPVLGICRGLQIINVFFGGTLTQNIDSCDIHTNIGLVDKVHSGIAKEGSFIAEAYGTTDITVNSAHHQAIKVLGEGLEPIQWSEDGIIEAVVHEKYDIVAVQWHPERMCLKNKRRDTVCGLTFFEAVIDQFFNHIVKKQNKIS